MGFVDRLSHPDAGIEPVVDLDRADLDAVAAAGAGIHIDIARVLADGDPEVPCFAVDSFHLGKGMDFNICMSLDIDHFRGKDAHGAVVCGKRLVELRHVAADGRFPLYQVDNDSMVCEIESGLDTGNPGPDDDNVIHGHIPRQASHRTAHFRGCVYAAPQ